MILYDVKCAVLKLISDADNWNRKRRWRKKASMRIGKVRTLTAEQKKQAKDLYAKYSKFDMNFIEFYTQKTGDFHENYIPADMYYGHIDPYFNDWALAKHMDNKCFYDQWYFKDINIPKTIVKRMNGFWITTEEDKTVYISQKQACELISKQDVFAKPATDSVGGKGVTKIKKGTSVDEIASILNSVSDKDIVVQEAVEQSEELNKLSASSVNTIRVLSMLNSDGSVKVYSTVVRIGINNSIVDNATSGGITCGVNSDGRLKPVAYSVDGKRYDEHPTNGVKFDSVVVPNYEKIISMATTLHKEFPHFRILSWDFAVDKNDEPLLIEVNLCYGGIDFHQINNGPLFGDDTNKILEEVFASRKK